MHDKINIPFVILVCLNKMIAPAKRPNTLLRPVAVNMAKTVKTVEIAFDLLKIAVRLFPDLKARRDLFIDQLVQLLKL